MSCCHNLIMIIKAMLFSHKSGLVVAFSCAVCLLFRMYWCVGKLPHTRSSTGLRIDRIRE